MIQLKQLVNDNNICSLPWVHAEINLQNNTIKPCCKYTEPLGFADADFKSVWYNQHFNDLRQDIANNNPRPECYKCNAPKNTFTYKSWKNKSYSHNGLLDNVNIIQQTLPKVFHFSLSNICNLACRMCWPGSSSKINALALKPEFADFFSPVKVSKIPISHFTGCFENAEYVTITGGEPFFNSDCILLVNAILKESKNLKNISFSTNMTTVNIPLLTTLINSNIDVTINVSIDGPDYIQEYIRQGCNWDTIVKNIKFLAVNFPKINFGINTTISALNIGYISELLSTINNLQTMCNIKFTGIMVSPVFNEYLHAGLLPVKIKQFYKTKLSVIDKELLSIPNSDVLVSTAMLLIENDYTANICKFLKFIEAFDTTFNTDFKTVYPEFKKLY